MQKTKRISLKLVEQCLALLYMFQERLINYECKQLKEKNYEKLEKTIENLEKIDDTIKKLKKETKQRNGEKK